MEKEIVDIVATGRTTMDTVKAFKMPNIITLRVVRYRCSTKMGGRRDRYNDITKRGEEAREAREVMCGNRSRDCAKVCVFRRTGAKKNYRPQGSMSPGKSSLRDSI